MPQLRLVVPTAGTAVDEPLAEPPRDAPAAFRPARLVLAVAGRCSCPACCAAYVAGRPEPHDPRCSAEQRRPRLYAV